MGSTVTRALKYYLHDTGSSFRFKLAGSLAGDDVTELRQCWTTASSTLGNRPFLVDIDGLEGLDEEGRRLLGQWHAEGARILAAAGKGRTLAQSITGNALAPAEEAPRCEGLSFFRFAALASAA